MAILNQLDKWGIMYESYDQSLVRYLLDSSTGWKPAAAASFELPKLEKPHIEDECLVIDSELVDQGFAVYLSVVLKMKQRKGIKIKLPAAQSTARSCMHFAPEGHPGIFIALEPTSEEIFFAYTYTWAADVELRSGIEVEELAAQCERILAPMVQFVTLVSSPIVDYLYTNIGSIEFMMVLELALSEAGEA